MFEQNNGTYAKDFTPDNFKIKSNIPLGKITVTPFVEKQKLHKEITDRLNYIEKLKKIDLKELNDLYELISLVPKNSDEKEEFEYRYKSLSNLLFISTELEKIEEGKHGDKFEETIEQIDALLKVSSHGPLRNLLEEEIESIKKETHVKSKELINFENLVGFINHADSSERIDEIFCELPIENYINLGEIKRKKVAEQFFEVSKAYSSNNSVLDDLNNLIINFIENDKDEIEEDTAVETHRQTIKKEELDIINNHKTH